jgi:hypothetical protein
MRIGPRPLGKIRRGMATKNTKRHKKGRGDRQLSVALGKHCLKDAGAVRFEWIVFGGVFRAVAHQPSRVMRMGLSTALEHMKRNGHKEHEKTQKGRGDRQLSVALEKHCLKDAGAVRFEWIVFGGVFRAVAHPLVVA